MPLEDSLLQQALRAIEDFKNSASENTTGAIRSLGQMFRTSHGDTGAAAEIGEGLTRTGEAYAKAGPVGRVAIAGELLTGLPYRQVWDDSMKGNYAKAMGHAAPSVGLLALGARGMRGKPSVASKPASIATALDSRISGIAPEAAMLPLEEILKAKALGATNINDRIIQALKW